MTRPHTAQDVFEAVRRARLADPGRLRALADRHPGTSPAEALAALVGGGLLTPFQAAQVATGAGDALRLGAYKVLDRLGRGGMGSVFLAEHAVLGKRAAVKVLSDALRADPVARQRFVREARAVAALNHPNVVAAVDADTDHDPPFLVMEYVDGVSLQEAVARAGALAAGEVAAVAAQTADGLACAAAAGLIHRDVKPANILIDRAGRVKVLDLGIARFTGEHTQSRVRGAEIILGTLDYLAPEQALDPSAVDHRADLYALGATLYFLLAGHPPYPGTDVAQKLADKQDRDPDPLARIRPDAPPEVLRAVHRLMARDPAARFPTAAAAAAAFRPWADTGTGFPARLFRPAGGGSGADRPTAADRPRGPLPDTVCIVRGRGPEPAPARPPEPPAPVPPPDPPVVVPPAPRPADRPFAQVVAVVAALTAAVALALGLFALAAR